MLMARHKSGFDVCYRYGLDQIDLIHPVCVWLWRIIIIVIIIGIFLKEFATHQVLLLIQTAWAVLSLFVAQLPQLAAALAEDLIQLLQPSALRHHLHKAWRCVFKR